VHRLLPTSERVGNARVESPTTVSPRTLTCSDAAPGVSRLLPTWHNAALAMDAA
jgi:hypothetical protein